MNKIKDVFLRVHNYGMFIKYVNLTLPYMWHCLSLYGTVNIDWERSTSLQILHKSSPATLEVDGELLFLIYHANLYSYIENLSPQKLTCSCVEQACCNYRVPNLLYLAIKSTINPSNIILIVSSYRKIPCNIYWSNTTFQL